MTPSEILMKHEDANEYHFHEVDRKWIIEAMEEYARVYALNSLPSDEEIDTYVKSTGYYGHCTPEYPKWMRDKILNK